MVINERAAVVCTCKHCRVHNRIALCGSVIGITHHLNGRATKLWQRGCDADALRCCDSGSYAQNHFRIEQFLTASRWPFAVVWGGPGLPCLVRINSHPVVVVVDHLLLFAHEIASSLMIQRVYNIQYSVYMLHYAAMRTCALAYNFLRSCTAFYDPSGVCVVCRQRRCPVALSSTSSSSSSSAWILLAVVVRTE